MPASTDTYTSDGAHKFFALDNDTDLLTFGGPTVTGTATDVYEFTIVQTASGLGNTGTRLKADPNSYVRDQYGNLYRCESYHYTNDQEFNVDVDGVTYTFTGNLLQCVSFVPVDETGAQIGPEIQTFTNHRFAENNVSVATSPPGAPSITFGEAMANNDGFTLTATADRAAQDSYGMDYSTATPEVWPYDYDVAPNPDGIVDGTSGDDVMVDSYDDGDTDQVGDGDGSHDDIIMGYGGNDTINAGAGNDTIDGGTGEDTLTGGDGDDVFVVSDGHDTITDFGSGNSGAIDDGDNTNNDFVDLSTHYSQANYDAAVLAGDIDPAVISNPLQWLQADLEDDGILNDTNAGWTTDNTLTIANGAAPASSAALTGDTTGVICFAQGTNITTDRGDTPIEDLSVGDMVLTQDKRLLPIKWISSVLVDAETLAHNPKLRPIRICAGALGNGLPRRDLFVSPQHRMLVRSRIAERIFDQTEVLVAAKNLTQSAGIDVADEITEVRYFHFLFRQHEVVFAEGTPSESLYTGPEALNSVSNEERKEIYALFPELKTQKDLSRPKPARFLAAGRPTKQLAFRHVKNQVPLVAHM